MSLNFLKIKYKTQWVYIMVTSQKTIRALPTSRDSSEIFMEKKYKAQLFSYKLELFVSPQKELLFEL